MTEAVAARLPTIYGVFDVTVHPDEQGREHLALRMGNVDGEPVLVRIHSECLTGDVFGSVRCDCREQLVASLEQISAEKRGVLIYLRQEGRGIGLVNKLRAYTLQDAGLDTVDANLHLGFPADNRRYSIAAAILRKIGATRVRLLTNNPRKIEDLEAEGIEVVQRVGLEVSPRPENHRYLQTKAQRLGHVLEEITKVSPAYQDQDESV